MKTDTISLPPAAGHLLLAGLCGAAFFFCAQASGPLASAGLFFRYDIVLLPVLAAGLFFLFSKLPEPLGAAAVPLLAACLCGLTLAGVREGLVSDLSTLAGLYPHSDGRNYLNGALNLLHGQPLNAFASRRPLSVIFWAALLRLSSGMDIKTAMELMVFLCALSIGWSVRAVIRQFGWPAGCLFFCGFFFFYRRFIGTFLTEHLGLALGCFGFLLVLRSLDRQRKSLFLAGLLLLTLALNVRAGAFFILPTLLLWAGRHWRQAARFSFTAAGLAVLAIGLGFALNSAALHLVGQEGAGQGNFSFTLYGLVHGGDWTLVKQQHPEILKLEEVERHKAIYKLAWAKIAAEPVSLLRGAMRAWAAFSGISQGPYSFVLFSLQQSFLDRPAAGAADCSPWEKLRRTPWKYFQIAAAYASSGLFLLLAVLGFFSQQHRQAKPLLLFSWLGILASVPFVPPWDADLMRAYAATMPLILFPAALGVAVLFSWFGRDKQGRAQEEERTSLLLPAGTILLFLILPVLFRRPQEQTAAAQPTIVCAEGEPQLLSLLPGSVLPIGHESNPENDSVSIATLRSRTGVLHSLNPRRADAFQHFSPGQTLALGYEHRSALLRYVVVSGGTGTFLPQAKPVCASPAYKDGMTTWWSIKPAAAEQ
ncbi:MAG: hypothetical protein ACTFAL_04395 [Candidatus Electronema sp. V4]|uniref:hypothetical protein n=1 Tax=Candidatus Electronema sp. V4 TaxID=3454756 RepID=UPI0040556595